MIYLSKPSLIGLNHMKTTLGIVIAVIIIILGYFVFIKKEVSAPVNTSEVPVVNVQVATSTPAATSTSIVTPSEVGFYKVFSGEKIEKPQTEKVVLFFRAGWCPTCRALHADIQANLKNIPSDLTILDVDYDNSTQMKQKYGVTYQHTFVQVDKDGNLIKKWSGSPTLAALVKEVK